MASIVNVVGLLLLGLCGALCLFAERQRGKGFEANVVGEMARRLGYFLGFIGGALIGFGPLSR